MAKPHPRGHRPTDSPNTFTRERWEQEVRGLAFRDPRVFDQIAKGRRTFTVREIVEMPESMQRCIKSIKVRHVTPDAGDGSADQVIDVKLWGTTRALKLAARAGMLTNRTDVTTSDETLAILDRRKLRN
jgi:hypothetical protein